MRLEDYIDLLARKEIDKNEFLFLTYYYKHGHCPNYETAKKEFDLSRATYFRVVSSMKLKFNSDIFNKSS